MTITVTPIQNNQTFGAWLSTTNRLANIISQNTVTTDSSIGGSVTTGNGYVNGYFGASYLYAEQALIGGNVSSNGTLNLIANAAFRYSTSNLVTITANGTNGNVEIRTNNTAIIGNTLFISASINSTSTVSLGGAVSISNTLSVSNAATFNDVINVENVIPTVTTTFDLGSPTNAFNNVYVRTVLFATGSTNSTIYTGTANNADNLNGQPASFYVNATNITTGTLPMAQLGSNVVNTTGSFTISGIRTHTANVHYGNSTVNTQQSNATILVSNSTSTTALGLTDLRIGNTATNVIIANTTSTFGGNVVIRGTANVAANLVVTATGELIISNGAGIQANGSFGTSGQVLASNGTGVYWSTPGGVDTTATYTWTGLNTFQANLHTGNTTVNTQVSNSILRISNSTSTTTIQLADIRVGTTTTNVVISNTTSSFGGNVTITGTTNTSGILFATANVHVGNSTVNTRLSNSSILISNSTSTTTLGLADLRIGTTTTNVIISNTTTSFGGNVTITGTANVAANLVVSAAGELIISNGAGIQANGVFGTSGQVLASNSTGVYWASPSVPRVGSVTSAATITPTADTVDQYNVTALATAATIAAPSGTPADGQKLILRFKDDGTARALTWTTSSGAYRAVGVELPTTTTLSKTTYVGCIYNSADTFWDVVASVTQA